jgi:hypothetical protein
VINRRKTGSASLGALESTHDNKDRWKTVGQEAFFLLTNVNHIRARKESAGYILKG